MKGLNGRRNRRSAILPAVTIYAQRSTYCERIIGLHHGNRTTMLVEVGNDIRPLRTYIAATLGVPGAFIGLMAASGRIHDIDLWITGTANFAFYFGITWLLLKLFSQGRRTTT